MDGDTRDLWWVHGGRLVFQGETFPLVKSIKAIQNLPKHRVHVVQVWLRLVQDEELRFVGVGSSISHTLMIAERRKEGGKCEFNR